MLFNISLGFLVMFLGLFIQVGILVITVQYYHKHQRFIDHQSITGALLTMGIILVLLIFGNLLQISLWALFFVWLEEFQTFKDAFYHSAVNFTSLGYGDIVMSEKHRVLGPIEALNGIVMVGVSTASVMPLFKKVLILEK
jgi:hypothetical protein